MSDRNIPDEDDTVCFYCGYPDCRCDDFDPDDSDDDGDPTGLEEDCHGFFESQSPDAVFVCGGVGSEDCDECPCHDWLGLTNRQIDELDTFDGELL